MPAVLAGIVFKDLISGRDLPGRSLLRVDCSSLLSRPATSQ